MKRILAAIVLLLVVGAAMSLHDIDKRTGGRITPSPNTVDSLQQYKAQGTEQVHNSTDSTETDGLFLKERQIVAVQDGENKAVMGFYGTANKFGLKVAKDGYDVLTTDDENLIFNSENNIFKVVVTSDFSIAGTSMSTGSTVTTTVPHGLGYTPALLIYVDAAAIAGLQNGNGLTGLPLTYTAVPNAPLFTIQYRIDDNNLYIDFSSHSSGTVNLTGYTWTFKYYLLQETAN